MTKSPDINRNIEGAPIIKSIKQLEDQLSNHKGDDDYTKDEKAALKKLLVKFGELLEVKYGAEGYLVSTTSEDVIHHYGVDTDHDFYSMTGSRKHVAEKDLDSLVEAGGGKVFMGEAGVSIDDPSETGANEKIAEAAIKKIMTAIKERISGTY